jgi:outer membrane beta-barrel protein
VKPPNGKVQSGAKRWMLACLVLITSVGAFPELVAAEDSLEDGPVVRRKLLYRSTRFEVAPRIGFTMNDAHMRNALVGADALYHLTNAFGLGMGVSVGALQWNTTLGDNVVATLERENPAGLGDLGFSYIQWVADLGLSYVPVFGKFAFMRSASVNYDLHLFAGVSIVGEGVAAAQTGGLPPKSLGGVRPGGVLGAGVRVFFSDMFSLNIDVKDYLYNRAQIGGGTAEGELSGTFVTSVGVGIFFPGEVKISR